MVRARNDMRLSEIKHAIEENNDTFVNAASISLPTIARQVSLKHIYLVPFERKNERVKQLRAEYVQIQHCILYYCYYLIQILIHNIILKLYCKNN